MKYSLVLFGVGYLGLMANLFLMGNDAPTEPQIAPPIAKTVALELPSGEGNPRNSEGAFIRLESGESTTSYPKSVKKVNQNG